MDMHLPILQVIVPLLAAPLVVLLRERGLAWAAATAASLAAFALAIYTAGFVRSAGVISYELGGWAPPYGIELVVDAFSSLLLLIVTGASSAALLISRAGLERDIDPDRQHTYYAAWLLAMAGLCGIVVAGDAFNIFVFMEISSLATYILIAGGRRRQALTAVFRYLIMGTIGATFYLIGVGYIYMMTGTLNLADMAARLNDVTELRPILIAGSFVTVGLALKAAVFPLHGWLPRAYAFAPHAATVFVAACSTKVALYVLFRFDFYLLQGSLPDHAARFAMLVLPLALAGIVVASVMALYQRDLKQLLAYSSVAQVGYMLFGAGLVSVTGLTGGIAHMFNHALAKGGLFIAVASLALTAKSTALDDLAGIARRMPLTMAAFVVSGLSLIGIPGTAGFIGKWYLVLGALENGWAGALLLAPLLAGSLLAALYIWRVIEIAYFGGTAQDAGRSEAPWPMLVVLWLVALGSLWFGLQPQIPLELAGDAARLLIDSAELGTGSGPIITR